MKILKTGKNRWLKWILIVLICYLLASYGVNGTVNPMVYFEAGQQADTLKMLEIWLSFVGITGFYIFMQWIKTRYAK
ncbi:MAG: hypothetical protein IJX63_02495 [Lachnospiraceae bacterium]|nr:hypothetical protein [Lachnospiraceae bacterium]